MYEILMSTLLIFSGLYVCVYVCLCGDRMVYVGSSFKSQLNDNSKTYFIMLLGTTTMRSPVIVSHLTLRGAVGGFVAAGFAMDFRAGRRRVMPSANIKQHCTEDNNPMEWCPAATASSDNAKFTVSANCGGRCFFSDLLEIIQIN